ncbi:MAG: hypothetical protein ABR552_01945 [Actinomycetota bacterium]
MRWVFFACVLALVSCTASPAPPDASVKLLGKNIVLNGGTDDLLRIGFRPQQGSALMRVDVEPVTTQVSLCPLRALDDTVRRTDCTDSVSGVREELSFPGMRAVAVVLHGSTATISFAIEYQDLERLVSLRLPGVPASPGGTACADNRCNPFFELTPTRNGAFSAGAAWSGPSSTLVLLQGRVLGRSQTATGIPYAEVARANGSSPLHIATQMTSPGEYALALRQSGPGAGALSRIAIDARWP